MQNAGRGILLVRFECSVISDNNIRDVQAGALQFFSREVTNEKVIALH